MLSVVALAANTLAGWWCFEHGFSLGVALNLASGAVQAALVAQWAYKQ